MRKYRRFQIPAITWRYLVWESGAFAFAVLMGGGLLFEYYTKPWRWNNVIPEPYIMIYGIATTICVYRNKWWGLAASLCWFAGAKYFLIHVDKETFWSFGPIAQCVRLALHITLPLLYARFLLQGKKQRDDLLHVLVAGIPHRFNSLLMVVIGNASLLHPIEGDRQYIDEVQKAAHRCIELVKMIQQYAKQGKTPPAWLDFNE